MLTSKLPVEYLLQEAEIEAVKYEWEGTFADYLHMAIENPGISRLSHRLAYDAITSEGVKESPHSGQIAYNVFDGSIFGLEDVLERIVQFFASSSRNLETRKRILVLLGPTASGKSSIAALIKRALEGYTRADEGAAYAIKGCPMQEDPLHLIPHKMRPKVLEEYGIFIEGDLCPRCRHILRNQYQGRISEVPVVRAAFTEKEAVGLGYYDAANPSTSEMSVLTGNIDTALLPGDRLEVAGKAVRMDGQMNASNRGLLEIDAIFKMNAHQHVTLRSLVEDQTINLERLGSIYADEVVIGHSSEAEYRAFMNDERSEILRGRLVAVRVPYNLRAKDEVRIYLKMLKTSGIENIHVQPLTLPTAAMLAVLTRLEQARKKGATLIDKLRAYDGQKDTPYSREEIEEERLGSESEGMNGLSPRYVVNRLIAAASRPNTACVTPLRALDSLWRGLNERGNLDKTEAEKSIEFIKHAVDEYNRRAIEAVQKAFVDSYEHTASELLAKYISDTAAFVIGQSTPESEHGMREIERLAGVSEKDKVSFRRDTHMRFEEMKRSGIRFDYTSEPHIKTAIEKLLLPDFKTLKAELSEPKSADRVVEWREDTNFDNLQQYYLLSAENQEQLVEASALEGQAKESLLFSERQWV
ncbi:MAG: protein prkA, partial [Chloroflexi bacterium]|nr:protein prkA [Chloroflexota bacterium]